MIKGCEGCKELFVHWGDVGLRTTFKSTSRDRVIRTKAKGGGNLPGQYVHSIGFWKSFKVWWVYGSLSFELPVSKM